MIQTSSVMYKPTVIASNGINGSQYVDPKTNSLINLDLLGETISLPGGNEENRALEDELVTRRKKLLKCQSELESLQEKTDALWKHMNNTRLDLNENQNLLRAKTSELETERSLCQTMKEQSQKLLKDAKKLELEFGEKRTKVEQSKALLEKQRRTFEQIQKGKRIDKEQFQNLVDEIVDADDLNVTIQKYLILDEKTMTELTNKLAKLSDQLSAKRRQLESIALELRAVENGLARANSDFQREQNDRSRLLAQWEQAVGLLQKRDADMEVVRRRLEEFRGEERTWRETLAEKEAEVRDQRSSEQELQKALAQLDQQLARLKSELIKRESEILSKRDRLQTVRALLHKAKTDAKADELGLIELNARIQENTKKLADLSQQKSDKLKRLDHGKSQNETIEGARNRLRKDLEREKQRYESSERNRRNLTSLLTKRREQIAQGKKSQKDLQMEYESLKTAHRNMMTKSKQLEKQASKQKEQSDAKEGEIERLERQLGQSIGVYGSAKSGSDPSAIKEDRELITMREKLDNARGVLMEKEATEQTWLSTIRISQTEMEKAKKQLDKAALTRKELNSTKGVHESETTILEKRLKKLMDQKQDALAQSNLLESEIKRLHDVLENKTMEVSNVEEAKEAQEASLKAQDQRLKHRKYEMQMKYLQVEEERKKIHLRLNEFQARINLLTTRYDELIRGSDESNEDANNANKLADLQKTRDDLAVKLAKSEKELTALQNTMRLIGERNQTFRQAVVQADRNCAEYREKFQLERQYQTLSEKYRDIRQKIKSHLDRTKTSKDKSIDMEHRLIQLDIDTKRAEEEIDRLKSEIADQSNKLDRWRSQNEKMRDEFERTCSAKKRSFVREDIDLRSMIAINSAASKALSELTREFPDLDGLVSNYCLKTGLELETASDSGIGSALTRRTTMPARSIRNGHTNRQPIITPKKTIDAQTLPPIAPKTVKTGIPVKLRSQSLNRSQSNRQAATGMV